MARKKKEWKPHDSPARWKSLLTKYGLSRTVYEKILQEQRGVCYICEKSPAESRPRRNLAVDHDHRTGRIRGLLCFNCNHRLLGWYIRDDVAKARRIVKYLTRKTNYGTVPDR
jgi:hypothetical protein